MSTTVITPTLDYSTRFIISDSCLTDANLVTTATGVSGSLGGLSSDKQCFMNNERVWQPFILNENDDGIVYSTNSMSATGTNMHEINFDGLEPETTYRAVLAFDGIFNENGGPNYFPANNYRITEFTTLAAAVVPGTPTAPGYTRDVPIGTTTLTIPFSTFVPAVSGNTFEELDITLRLGADVRTVFDQFTLTGTDETSFSSATSVLAVTGNTVVITTTLPMDRTEGLTFGYSVTNTAGVSSPVGAIQFGFLAPTIAVTANTHTVMLPNLFGLPIIDLSISDTVITDTLLEGSTLGLSTLADITFTTNATGNATGTIAITAATSSTGPIFQYMPPSDSDGNLIVGTEAFAYTATLNSVSGSSTLYIVVPPVECDNSMFANFSFGSLSEGQESAEESMTMMNTGNVDNQFMIRGENWKSGADGTNTMNAEITKYSLTANQPYADDDNVNGNNKTALTVTPLDLGGVSQDNVPIPVYLQVLVDLIDDTFRGATTQVMTVSSSCT